MRRSFRLHGRSNIAKNPSNACYVVFPLSSDCKLELLYIIFCCRSLVLLLDVLLQWGISSVSFIEKRKWKKNAVVCQ
jgi:hypothetical protein